MKPIEILLVEENSKEAALVCDFISQRYNAHVTIARDGEEALRLLVTRGYCPDLILLDLMLSKLSGHEAVKRIRRSIALKVPIVVMSTSRNPDDVSFAYALGVNAYVEKPLKPEELVSTMQSVARLWVEPLVREHF
jgi:DNA-binding response OmpR family regulator